MSPPSAELAAPAVSAPVPGTRREQGSFITLWTHLAFGFTALGGLLEASVSDTARALPLEWIWALGAAFILLGTYGIQALERRPHRPSLVPYFVVMTALAMLLLWLSRGTAWLLGMPLISQFVLYVSVPAASVAATGLIGSVLWGWYPGRECEVPGASLGLLAAATFVIAFSALAKREVAWRVRSDQLTERLRRAHREAVDRAAQVAELSAREERTRIARELHDALGHYLSAIHVHLEGARALLPHQPTHAVESLNQAQALSRRGLDEVRAVVTLMRTPSLPLCEVLEALIRGENQPHLQVALEVEGAPREVPEDARHALVRVAQEALTNVRRHAHARRATLRVSFAEDHVQLAVEDDGAGSAQVVAGFGLTGAQERIEALSGSLFAGQGGTGGFVVRAEVPT